MDSLFSYYSRSPDHCRMVHSVSETLGTEIRKIGKIFDVRWLSSSYRSSMLSTIRIQRSLANLHWTQQTPKLQAKTKRKLVE